MYRGSGPRIFPIIIVIIVVALIIAALVSVGRVMFAGNNGTTSSQKTSASSVSSEVLNSDTNRGVRFTVRGPIVADENFRSYQITVTPTSRVYTEYAGYLDKVITTRTLTNNQKAYEQFTYALDKADIGKTRTLKDNDDLRGICATGGRAYKFETLDGNTATKTLWTSTCSGSQGTMASNVLQIHALFANQIPDFKPIFDKVQ